MPQLGPGSEPPGERRRVSSWQTVLLAGALCWPCAGAHVELLVGMRQRAVGPQGRSEPVQAVHVDAVHQVRRSTTTTASRVRQSHDEGELYFVELYLGSGIGPLPPIGASSPAAAGHHARL